MSLSCQQCSLSESNYEKILILGILCKKIIQSLWQCKCHERKKIAENCFGLKEGKEIWQLNAMHDSSLGAGMRGMKSYKRFYWDDFGNLNIDCV